MYLYEIPQAYKTILDNADPETGEIDYEALDMLEDSLHSKADAYAKIIRSLSAQSAAVESEIERLEALKTANDNKVARLKENLLKAMESMDDEKFKTDLFHSASDRQALSLLKSMKHRRFQSNGARLQSHLIRHESRRL